MEILALFLAAAIASGAPILMAGLGELVTERAGVLNLGVEGIMAVGALAGFAGALASGSAWLGVSAAVAAGAAISLLHAATAVWLRADQVVSGLALVILGGGLASWGGRDLVGQVAPSFADVSVPGLSQIPLLGPALFHHDPLVLLSLVLPLAVWWFLKRTRPGLMLEICGENPRLVDLAGGRPAWIRIGAIAFGGALAGLAGATLSLAETPSWVDGLTGGRGWIAVAMVIFAGWSPLRLAAGAWLFGGLVAIQFRAQAFGFSAPPYLLKMAPYLATLVVLALASRGRLSRSMGAPAALGRPYGREER